MFHELKRLVREDNGMEFVEWSILGLICAFAAVQLWSRKGHINAGLYDFASNFTTRYYIR